MDTLPVYQPEPSVTRWPDEALVTDDRSRRLSEIQLDTAQTMNAFNSRALAVDHLAFVHTLRGKLVHHVV